MTRPNTRGNVRVSCSSVFDSVLYLSTCVSITNIICFYSIVFVEVVSRRLLAIATCGGAGGNVHSFLLVHAFTECRKVGHDCQG